MGEESARDTDDESTGDAEVAEELRDDPDAIDRAEKYEDRYLDARESANPDDHRDEEPHNT